MNINLEKYVFEFEGFQDIVESAVNFFEKLPMHTLESNFLGGSIFLGTGVYALYYTGNTLLYDKIPEGSLIYVGKAVPKGWRTARSGSSKHDALRRRIREHTDSIQQANNLNLTDFKCRFMILKETASQLITLVEALLIQRYKPVWNCEIDGFGNHDPGKGRRNQAKSAWDILHPGRSWAKVLPENKKTIEKNQ